MMIGGVGGCCRTLCDGYKIKNSFVFVSARSAFKTA